VEKVLPVGNPGIGKIVKMAPDTNEGNPYAPPISPYTKITLTIGVVPP